MVVHDITRRVDGPGDAGVRPARRVRKVVRTDMARKTINKLVGRVKRAFTWAVEEESVPVPPP